MLKNKRGRKTDDDIVRQAILEVLARAKGYVEQSKPEIVEDLDLSSAFLGLLLFRFFPPQFSPGLPVEYHPVYLELIK
jgi:hypothetical protein